MPTLDELLVKIDASTELLRRELNKGEKSVTKFERSVDRKLGNIDKRFGKLGSSLRNALGAFGISLGAFGVVQFTRSVVTAGLQMERYERTLKFATGSQEDAEREMGFLRKEADRLGLSLQSLVGDYANLAAASKGTELQGQGTRDIFIAVNEAARVLGLTAEQRTGALRALEQMISKGNVQAEELRGQLGERLPGAFQIAARAMNVTTEELNDMLERGDVAATDLLPKLAKELHRTFGPEVVNAVDGAQAAFERFNTAFFELKASIAESGLIDFFADMANATATAINPSLELQLARVQKRLMELHQQQSGAQIRFGASPAIDREIARMEAETDRLIEAIRKRDTAALNLPTKAPVTSPSRFPITNLPAPVGFPTPATVRLGGGEPAQPPVSAEDVRRVNDSLAQLREQALRAQGRMAEAIRAAADQQIAQWERVAEETPAFAEKAADAIALINQKAEADIKALSDSTPAAKEFANAFAAAFESRGMDALLNGDVSDALRGMTQDIIELIYRLVILKPLAEKLGTLFGGGGSGGGSVIGGFFDSLFGGGFSLSSAPVGPPRAAGGRVSAGVLHRVNEFDTEMFVPDVPGRILNAAQLSGMSRGSGVTVHQEFNVQAGLPPQWHEQTFTAAQLAAAAAKDAVHRELRGRR